MLQDVEHFNCLPLLVEAAAAVGKAKAEEKAKAEAKASAKVAAYAT